MEELLEQPARCPLCNTAFTKEDMKPFARRNNHSDAHEGDDDDEDTGTGKGKPKRKGGQDKVSVKKRKTNISNSPKLESASSKCDSLKSKWWWWWWWCQCIYVQYFCQLVCIRICWCLHNSNLVYERIYC